MATQRIRIGQVAVISDGSSVAMTLDEGGNPVVYFDRDGVRQLMDFLRGAMETRFDERNTQRVQVFSSSGLEVLVETEQGPRAASARNISLAGMLLDTGGDDTLQFHVGDSMTLAVSFEGTRLRLKAVVQRRAGTGYGLQFPECTHDGRLVPPDELVHIVAALQKRHAQRLQVGQ